MKKKSISALLSLSLAITIALSGCGNTQSATSSTAAASTKASVETASSAAVTGDTEATDDSSLSIRVSDDPLNINPLYVTDLNSFTIMQAIFSPYFEIVNGEVYYGNGLLESVEANENSTEFTLILKDELKWHDGEPITSDDVVFSTNVALDEKQAVPYSTYLFDSEGNPGSVSKVDDKTAKITFKVPNTGFLGSLSQLYCIPEHIYKNVKNIGESELNYEPVGNGPYKFASYNSGQTYTVERFDDYFGTPSNIKTINFKIIKDTNTAIAALQSGDLDAMSISGVDYQTVAAIGGVSINHYNSGNVDAIGFNQLNDKLADSRVRQAIAYALNKEELIQFAYTSLDFAQPAYSILTPDTLYYDDSLTKIDNDPEKAKELLKDAGAENLELKLLYSTSSDINENTAVYIQSKLADVGITVTLDPEEDSVYKNSIQEENNTSYDLVLQKYELGAEPSLYADILSSGSRSNYSHVNDENLDSLWNKGLSVSNGDERKEIYRQIQELVNDNQYLYPIDYTNGFFVLSDKYTGFDDFLLQTIYYDYSKLERVN